jgi:hypothetical protein
MNYKPFVLFTAQPKAPASKKAGASGWAVNESPQDATKSTTRLSRFILTNQTGDCPVHDYTFSTTPDLADLISASQTL